jgi:hypothetical protein
MLFFWVVKLCGLPRRYQRFGGTYCHNPEDHRHPHRCENLRSHIFDINSRIIAYERKMIGTLVYMEASRIPKIHCGYQPKGRRSPHYAVFSIYECTLVKSLVECS